MVLRREEDPLSGINLSIMSDMRGTQGGVYTRVTPRVHREAYTPLLHLGYTGRHAGLVPPGIHTGRHAGYVSLLVYTPGYAG